MMIEDAQEEAKDNQEGGLQKGLCDMMNEFDIELTNLEENYGLIDSVSPHKL